MKKIKFQIISFFLISILLTSGFSFGGSLKQKIYSLQQVNDFYFVQITDTHVMHKIFDRNETSKNRFKSALNQICSFENKPAFIVITGDLTNWGGSWVSGALNCKAFASCLYEKDGQFYADEQFLIPVYTTPGNHEYNLNRNLKNYYKFIENEDRYIVNYNNVSLFFMNSGPSYYGEFYDWFNNIDGFGFCKCDMHWLESSFENYSANLKIVLMHHPAINSRDEKGEMHGVFVHYKKAFVELCADYNIDLVLAGHTHVSQVFNDSEYSYVFNDSLNCSLYPTLFVQTDDCKHGINYRNVSIIGNDIWLENSVELEFIN